MPKLKLTQDHRFSHDGRKIIDGKAGEVHEFSDDLAADILTVEKGGKPVAVAVSNKPPADKSGKPDETK